MLKTSETAVFDIEKQNRLSKVISLHSKGLNQEEIARELYIDQSTVSRDLQYIKHEARIKIEMYLREDILFEYVRYMAGSNEITRHLWEIVEDSDSTTKEKTNALSCLMQSYNSRLQTLTSGPESYMNSIVGAILLRADTTSFRPLPKLFSTRSTRCLFPLPVESPPHKLVNEYHLQE